MSKINRTISVAPMMDWTDRHDRYFLRLIAPDILLYSEMITAQAIKFGDKDKLLGFHDLEHPLALQIGGSDPALLAHAAKVGEQYGYDEINLNVGCPSERVKSGSFGACLMKEPELVAECISAMMKAVSIPVTVKCRIGVDELDAYDDMKHFVTTVAQTGCNVFIIHARKAWLQGLSPKENREIPPLRYADVAQLKNEMPHLTIILNGGIKTEAQIDEALVWADGVMIGREAYHNPYWLSQLQNNYYQSDAKLSRKEVVDAFIPYVEHQLANGVKLSSITRHIIGLFQTIPGAAKWRRYISEHAYKKDAGTDVIMQALMHII